MTIINRALHKAYQRRTDSQAAPPLEARSPSVTGWASKVRDPIRPIPAPDRASSPQATTATQSEAPPAPAIAQVLSGKGPVVVPAPAAVRAPQALSGGTTVRFDSGHLRAKPQAQAEAPAAETMSSAAGETDAGRKSAGDATVAEKAATGKIAAGTVAAQNSPRWSWPPIVGKLLDCPAGVELRKLAGSLKQLANTRNLSCVALSGPGRSTGRTSLVLTLAHILAETQFCRVAIVDADFGHPDAAQVLSLSPRQGLWEAASRKEAGASSATVLIPEKLAIVPLVDRIGAEGVDRKKIAGIQSYLRALRREYDLVLVDAGPWEALVPPLVFESRAVDAFLCVARCGWCDERLDDDLFRQPGIEWLGMIETFSPARAVAPLATTTASSRIH
jgi:Mrp family chromosome partitioning ATPase